ncbi:MAG: ATP phosphoribosyltransferase regulatory subunit [Rhodospirillales bacterium]
MNDSARMALLPNGLRDILPPQAEHEAGVLATLCACFASRGYDRAEPPMVEFEDALLQGGGDIASQTFRLMDPVSQRMMGLRADMTPQIARIATTRLRKAPRPLRLSYAGSVLRVKGAQLRPERQFAQAGIEIIGADDDTADAEVIALCDEALAAIGIDEVTVDLFTPNLVDRATESADIDRAALREALDHKDEALVRDIAGDAAPLLGKLMRASGAADKALERLDALDLGTSGREELQRLRNVIKALRGIRPDIRLTVDPVENRGFEYHTGVSFALFGRGVRGELGRGGRYVADGGEPATGATLYLDSLLRALPKPSRRDRLYLPVGPATGSAQRAEGWTTVAALNETTDAEAEAKRLGCSHWLDGAIIRPVTSA